MAKVQRVQCDKCEKVLGEEDIATTQEVKLTGLVNGVYSLDLCAECLVVPEGVTLRQRRSPEKSISKETTAQAPDGPSDATPPSQP
jgi:hypothetical protein